MKILASVGRGCLFLTILLFNAALNAEETIPWKFPKETQIEKGALTIHTPQVVDWPEFERAKMLMAIEVKPADGGKDIYATVEMSGTTEIDMDERIVSITDRLVQNVTISGEEYPALAEKLSSRVKEEAVVAPLDVFLLSVAQDAIEIEHAEGFNPKPPKIVVATSPTIVLSIVGAEQLKKMENTRYSVVQNANWPLVKAENEYFLLFRAQWWQASKLNGKWQSIKGRPAGLEALSPEGAFKDFLVEPQPSTAISIVHSTEPTELIVMDGPASLEPIEGAEGLEFVSNTDSPLFYYERHWYFLAAGRWFKTSKLDKPEWEILQELPEVFSQIPEDNGMSFVRVSVPGTVEAKLAVLEASLPQEKSVSLSDKLELTDQYDGKPQWEKIPSTTLVRAINSPYDIFEFQGVYYLCYEGAWYQADVADGPWEPALRVPDVVYDIPAESASYPVTQVTVQETTQTTVVYSAPTSYYTGVYSYYGFPVYGTGWYYPPYWGLYWYYPRYMAYGHASFYNPWTGGFGSRSVWYGPYGGYSYNHHYNPRTGTRGWVETAWDGDEWASYGERYNPRRNLYTETERYYNDDHHRMEMDREIYRGDKSMGVEREIDFDDGWSTTERSTSEGGSSYVERHRQEDGSWTSEGTFQTGDGKSGTIEGKIDDGTRTTKIAGDDGGGLISKGDGTNRGSLGKDSDGNLYAGHDGNVYRRTDDGWQHYDRDDGWSDAKKPERTDRERTQTKESTWQNNANNRTRDNSTRPKTSWSDYNRSQQSSRMSQLNRDYHSRQMGNYQFQQKRNLSRNRMGSGRMSTGRARGFRR